MNIGKENEKLEFKKSTSELKESLKDISAILNKHGKGSLFFGVLDDGTVCGMQIGAETKKDIVREIQNHIKPFCMFEVIEQLSNDEKSFIEIKFYGDNVPYSAYDRFYLRFNDSSLVMDRDLLMNYFYTKSNDYSKWENNSSNIRIDEIDEDLLIEYINKGNEAKRIPFKYLNKYDTLNKLGLMFDKETLNNAGASLFSNQKPINVKFASFATEAKITFLDMRIFSGNIFECINESMNYIRSHINYSVQFDGNIKRIDVPEIPLIAVREIVVNAFAHGSYDANTEFEICIYRNRVTIYSPGHFPKPYTPEQFVTDSLEPIPFNPKIVEILYGNETIEKFATGFGRAFESLKKQNVHYDYLDTGNGFRFTFYRQNGDINGDINGEINLNKSEKLIYNILKVFPSSTANDLEKKSGLSSRTISRIVNSLKEKEIITRIGSNKSGYWRVK